MVGGALNDLVDVGHDLTLDGKLDIATSGSLSPGIYRLFNYGGALTGLGLTIEATGGLSSANLSIQTAVDHQVNLINTNGLVFRFWDGDATGLHGNDAINGTGGVWRGASDQDWTEDLGHGNGAFQAQAFAVFMGTAGTVAVDPAGGVVAAGMQFMTDGYAVTGGSIALDSNIGTDAVIRVGDGTSDSAGMTALISSALTGADRLVKEDAGRLILAGTNSYTGGTAVNGGVLQIAGDDNLGAGGTLSFGGGTLATTGDFTLSHAIDMSGNGTLAPDAGTVLTLGQAVTGAGTLTVDGGGKVLLTSDSSGFTGTADVQSGVFSVNGRLGGTVDVMGGRLQGSGVVGATTNEAGGTVAPGNSIATLTVAGNYVGNGGTLEIEAVLGDDSSATDQLAVTGDTSGTTKVKVINLGGAGGQTFNGIKIVDVGGASNGVFTLLPDYLYHGDPAVVAGAYSYRLFKGGLLDPADGDWYLRSALTDAPLLQPGAPVYESLANVLGAFNGLDSFKARTGGRQYAGAAAQGLWGRVTGGRLSVDPAVSTAAADYGVNTWQLQAGTDGLLTMLDGGALVGGVSARYGTLSADIGSIYGNGSIAATGYGLGGTLTWLGDSGLYVDAQANLTWYDSSLATSGIALASGIKGFGYALGLEAGQEIALGGNWSITPQAQLSYASVRYDSFADRFGAAVSLDRGDALTGRIGVSADYKAGGLDAYGLANVSYDLSPGAETELAGVKLTSQQDPLWGSIGFGGAYSWGNGKYAVNGQATLNTSLSHFGGSSSVSGTAGFHVKF